MTTQKWLTTSCQRQDHLSCPGWFREDMVQPWSNQICACDCHADRPATHNVEVVSLTALFQAQCSCGWKGWARSKREVAYQDKGWHAGTQSAGPPPT